MPLWCGVEPSKKALLKALPSQAVYVAAPNQEVTVRWKGRSYAATVIRVGMAS